MKTTDLQHSNTASRFCEQLENSSKDAVGVSLSSPEAQPSEENNELRDFEFNEEIYNELSGLNSKQEDELEDYYPDDDYEYDPNHKYSQTIHILERERTPEEEHELTEMIAEERNRWHLNVVYHEMLPNKMLKVAKEERDPEWDGEPAKSTSKPSMSIHVVYEELTEEVNNAIHELIHEKQENWQVKLVYCNLLPNGIIEEDFSLTFP